MKELLHKGMEASPEKYLPHLITEEERTHFEENGYLYVPNALSTEMREQLIHAVDTLHNKALASGRAKPDSHWGWSDFLGADEALLNLVDFPTTLPESLGEFWGGISTYTTPTCTLNPQQHRMPKRVKDGWNGTKTADVLTSNWKPSHAHVYP